MHSISLLLAISILIVLSISTPLPHTKKLKARNGFSVVQSIKVPGVSGPAALKQAYLKYGIKVPPTMHIATLDGSVSANPEQYDSQYLSPVNIGGQTVNLDFDTGSADLWVFSSELPATQQVGHDVYNPTKSKTSKRLNGYNWTITYGDQSSAGGSVVTDTVTVGGTIVKGQAVELAQKISAQFQQDRNNDGLLGLAYSSINRVRPKQQLTFFDNAVQQGILTDNVFTADLKKGVPGTYDFGYIDDDKYTGDIHYTSINPRRGFWEFTGTGYGVGSSTFNSTNIDAIADTGTTLLLMDDAIVATYYKQVKGAQNSQAQGGWIFPCSTVLPSFTVGIGSYKSVIPGTFINFAPVSTTQCYGGIQSNGGLGLSIYGDIFLKTVFAVFDADNQQFGVAAKDL